MKKHFRITLGKKLAFFYLILVLVSLLFITTAGNRYIHTKVLSETTTTLREAATVLLDAHINQQAYTKSSIQVLRTQLEMASEVAECRIMIICDDGDVVVDTGIPVDSQEPLYNVYRYNSAFLRDEYTLDFTMNGYLKEPSLTVCLPMERNPYLNGYLMFAQSNSFIDERADYYFNILMSLFYIMITIVGLAFLLVYWYNFRPLRKIRNGAKDFSIYHRNEPLVLNSNDEYGELAQTLNVIGAELNKFDEYQRKFVSNISHDFRSPLTSISGYVQAMADGIITPENQEKYLNIILFETDRLTKLTSNLLDVSNFDKDRIFLDITSFDMHEMIRNTLATLEGVAEKKMVSFAFRPVNDKPLMVSADKDKIHQVLYNLVDNAVKFSHSNSQVTITTRSRGGKIFVSVKDTGIGIPKEDIHQIWDRFYKTDLSRGKDKLGTGLGLSISREIMNAHKQTIDVVSTAGVGSEFVFTLPKAPS